MGRYKLLALALEAQYEGNNCFSPLILPAAAAKSLQSHPTLCDPIDRSPPGSAIPGILQARVLEWGAVAFSVNST